MGTLQEDLNAIDTLEDKVVKNKVARFAYTEEAYTKDIVDGVEEYDVNKEQNIPVGSASVMKVNETVLNRGYRAQASSITRMLMNHFLGRLSYNLNKVNDVVSSFIKTVKSHLGSANGIATLDATGRIPYAQLPESTMEFKGTWDASTNTPTLTDGNGRNGNFYVVSVAGTQTFGGVEINFNTNDRIIYNGATSSWTKLSSGDVRTVNSIKPDETGNITLDAPDVNAVKTINSRSPQEGTGNINLESLSINGQSFNGSAPVSVDTMKMLYGGTGATNAKGAEFNITAGMKSQTSDFTDTTKITCVQESPSASTGRFFDSKASYLWNYIKDKISSVLGLTATNYGGTALMATNAEQATRASTALTATNAEQATRASTAGTADKTVNDITIEVPVVKEGGQYVIPFGNIPEPTSTTGNSPYNWDITGFFSIIRSSGHNGSHLWFEAGHGYSHDWTTYAYLDKLDFRGVIISMKAFQYNEKWWLGLHISTSNQGYNGKMTITYSRRLPATPTCILYNSVSNGVANEEIYNSIQDIPSSWWKTRTICNSTTFLQNITAPVIQATTNFIGNVSGNSTTATTADKVKNALTINGQSFDGSSAVNISIQEGAYDHIVHDNASLLEWANCTDGSMKKVLIKSGTYNMTKGVNLSKAGTGYVLAEQGAVINSHVPVAFEKTNNALCSIYNIKVVCCVSENSSYCTAFKDSCSGHVYNKYLVLYNCKAGYDTVKLCSDYLFLSCWCFNCIFDAVSTTTGGISVKIFSSCYCTNCVCTLKIQGTTLFEESDFFRNCTCINCRGDIEINVEILYSTDKFCAFHYCYCIACDAVFTCSNPSLYVQTPCFGFNSCSRMSCCYAFADSSSTSDMKITGIYDCSYISSTNSNSWTGSNSKVDADSCNNS